MSTNKHDGLPVVAKDLFQQIKLVLAPEHRFHLLPLPPRE